MSSTDDRLIDLEIKFAHQERAIERLEAERLENHRMIEEMRQALDRLSNRFEALTSPEVGPGDQKPPHY